MQRMETRRNQPFLLYHLLLVSMLLAGIIILFIPNSALGQGLNKELGTLSPCPPVGAITNQSLLIVLLDRSGSLTYQPGATDPDGYSTSVTKALADLWPGFMAVIPFSQDTTPMLGNIPLSDHGKRDALKQQIQQYPIGGDTPLAPALHKALSLLQNAPVGSRVVIVTDGNPDPPAINGVNQASDIRNTLIPQFCAKGTPVTAFGLALNLDSADGQAADHLLNELAARTRGTYANVRNSTDLAQVVIKLYADWQHLTFVSTQEANNNYVIPIDTYAKRVTFVIFRANDSSPIALNEPNQQPIPTQILQTTTDRHYEIDNLLLSDVNQPGPYTIKTSNNTDIHVYALVETRLHAVLKQPTTQYMAHIGQPFEIQAELLEDNVPIIPKANEATLNAKVTLSINGQITSTETVELTQQSDGPLFTNNIALSGPAGQVHIQIQAVYTQIPVEASEAQVSFSLAKTIVVRPHNLQSVPVCGTNFTCYIQRFMAAAVGIPLALLLLLLLLFRTRLIGPYGSLAQGKHIEILSSLRRPFPRRIFHKSTLTSRDLESYGGFDFGDAAFDLHFSKTGVIIRAQKNTPPIAVRKKTGLQKVTTDNHAGVEIQGNDAIVVERKSPAVYKESENV